jgi:oxygen-dependent protoporphyrinogen oxidase
MPVYSLQHKEAVDNLNEKLSAYYPNIFLAGCSYYGVGIAACIANGQETAERIEKQLQE